MRSFTKIYGGKKVVLTANAQKQAKQLEDMGFGRLPDLCCQDSVQSDGRPDQTGCTD